MKSNKNHISKETYRTIMDKVPICCVDVIFLNRQKNKILLCKRNNEPVKNIYYTIGGRLNKGETFLECALRQAKRELGLTLDPKKTLFAGIIQDNHKNSVFKRVSYHVVNIFYYYILEEKKLDIKFDKQHNDYKWFDLKDKTLHPYIKERIRQTLLILKK